MFFLFFNFLLLVGLERQNKLEIRELLRHLWETFKEKQIFAISLTRCSSSFAAILCHSLRITKVSVPTPMIVGDSGTLECQWVSEGNSVYSLKWYLGLHEFYRWTPAAHPKIQTFSIDKAFKIDRKESEEGRVRIRNVTLDATGLLRCEISEEAPAFHTEHSDVRLTVIGRLQMEFFFFIKFLH